jgi:hypothetical protein
LGRLDDKLEGAPVTQPNGCEVSQVPRRQAADADGFGEGHDRRVYQAESQIRLAPVDLHRAGQVTKRRRSVGQGASRDVLHEQLHRSAPVSQISAAALPAGTEQLALVAALSQRANDSGAARLGMPAVLFQD